jgi:hypothetical protein
MGRPKGSKNKKKGNVIPLHSADEVARAAADGKLASVTLHFIGNDRTLDALRKEAKRERRELSDHVKWLLDLLYNPPLETSGQRARNVARFRGQAS